MSRHGFEIKTNEQIVLMREAGLITAAALREVRKAIRPGVTTLELEAIAEATIAVEFDHAALGQAHQVFDLDVGATH